MTSFICQRCHIAVWREAVFCYEAGIGQEPPVPRVEMPHEAERPQGPPIRDRTGNYLRVLVSILSKRWMILFVLRM